MTISLAFYADSGGTTTATNPLPLVQDVDGVLDPDTATVYLLSLASGKKFQAASDPGVDSILVTIDDQETGTGQAASAITLATSEAGLSTAVAGEPLDLGPTLLSGTANATPIWIQFDDDTGVVATDLDIRLLTNALVETDV